MASILGRAAVLCLIGTTAAFATETITVRSGNGNIGEFDSQVSRLVGPADTGFANLFTAADFESARQGNPGCIIANHGAWISTLPADPQARWISTSFGGAGEGATALYAVEFTVSTASIGSSQLVLHYAVDNTLGWGPNVGVYLNELPVAGSNGGGFGGQFQHTLDVSGMLQPGSNWLYINAVDLGGPGGLIFSAQFGIEPGAAAATEDLPLAFELAPNWPNPFNPSTRIDFSLADTGPARLDVYSLQGTRVAQLVNGMLSGGSHSVTFDGTGLASGIYIYSLEAGGQRESRRMLLVK
ncbi:MAG: T9SS type A sorting domain-containing protein [Candidatus Delongbacteria bacterium]|nr:T9SS type A sorting domain-containing protein [Candidatus Delongbacteria bacterium]